MTSSTAESRSSNKRVSHPHLDAKPETTSETPTGSTPFNNEDGNPLPDFPVWLDERLKNLIDSWIVPRLVRFHIDNHMVRNAAQATAPRHCEGAEESTRVNQSTSRSIVSVIGEEGSTTGGCDFDRSHEPRRLPGRGSSAHKRDRCPMAA